MTLGRTSDPEKSCGRTVLRIFLCFKTGGTRAHVMLLMGKKSNREGETDNAEETVSVKLTRRTGEQLRRSEALGADRYTR